MGAVRIRVQTADESDRHDTSLYINILWSCEATRLEDKSIIKAF